MLSVKLIGSIIFNVGILFVLLFLPAGTLHWWRAWVIIGLDLVGTVGATISLSRGHLGLLEERLKPPVQKGQPLADKVLVILLFITYLGSILSIPLDVFRFHLMGKPGTLVSSLGLALLVVGGSPT